MLRFLIMPRCILFVLFCLSIFLSQPAFSDELLQSSKTVIENLDDKTQQEALEASKKALADFESTKPVLPILPKPELFESIQTQEPVDIGKLASQGQNIYRSTQDGEKRYESQVLIFISSSMPDQTVTNYLDQSRRINASLVLRGFVNDTLTMTKQYLHGILVASADPEADSNILIDPTLYERFSITQVPSIVVTESAIQPCMKDACPPPVHHIVSGDVSLAWALGLVGRQIKSEALRSKLRPMIKTLEGGLQ